jgi:diketogulonate reductase-like aldo/keto reductase
MSAIKIPSIGLGTWKSATNAVGNAVEAAILAGYRHIDCAAAYDNEKEVGKALKKVIGVAVKREELFITSKLWNTDHANVREAFSKSLKDLELSYLDLYLIHWPMAYDMDENGMDVVGKTPIKEVWQEMEKLVDEGLVKHIGLSNFNSAQITEILDFARIKPSLIQVECHPYLTQVKLSEFAKSKGLVFQAFAPLGSPDRPNYLKAENEPEVLKNPVVLQIAQKHQKSPAQVLLRFQIERGHVVLVKSLNPSNMKENLEVLNFTLDKGDMEQLIGLNKGFRYYPMINEADHPRFPFKAEF